MPRLPKFTKGMEVTIVTDDDGTERYFKPDGGEIKPVKGRSRVSGPEGEKRRR